MIKVLFICLGNICRSPTAEGVLTDLVKKEGLSNQIYIDSAGTHAYHAGESPDSRARNAARKRGIHLDGQRARQVKNDDFSQFNYLLAMDKDNYWHLQKWCPQEQIHKLHLFLDFAPHLGVREVPDPYYGVGDKGFERMLDLIEAASAGLLADIRQHLN
jgi:protein-tyrosine phosphatase